MMGLLFAGLAAWTGCLASISFRAAVGISAGRSGGPPNYILPSLMLGVFLGMLGAFYISHVVRRWTDGAYTALAVGVCASAILPIAMASAMPFG